MAARPGRLPLAVGAALLLLSCTRGGPEPQPDAGGSSGAVGSAGSAPAGRGEGCARLVSAIGYAEQVLEPAGREERQEFGEEVRGRLAYVAGTVVRFEDTVPAPARAAADAVRRDAEALVSAATPRDAQVDGLRRYLASAAAALSVCEGPPGTRP